MIRLATTTSPVDLAWAAFDAAALRLNHLYQTCDLTTDTPADRTDRMMQAAETVRLWAEYRELFLGGLPGDVA